MPRAASIYRDNDFHGHVVAVYEGHYSKKRLEIWELHDKISSVSLDPGIQVTLFENNWWAGERQTITQDTPSIGALEGRVSSLIVQSDKTTPQAVVCSDPNFHHDATYFDPLDNEDDEEGYFHHLYRGVGEDAISSVVVPDGLLVILFENNNYTGRVCGLTNDCPDLTQVHFDNITSSIRVCSEAQFTPALSQGKLSPYPRLQDYDTSHVTPLPPIIVAETLVPFMYVNDPLFVNASDVQAKRSPYYRLTRESEWIKSFAMEHDGAATYSYYHEWEAGVEETVTNSIKKTLTIETSEEDKLNFTLTPVKGVNLGVDHRVTTRVEKGLEVLDSTTKVIKMAEKKGFNLTVPAKKYSVIIWLRKETYSVRRWDDNELITSWSFITNDAHMLTEWPPVA